MRIMLTETVFQDKITVKLESLQPGIILWYSRITKKHHLSGSNI